MSFLPDILTGETLDLMAYRLGKRFALQKPEAQQVLADTLGFSDWITLRFPKNPKPPVEIVARPAPHPSTSWLSQEAHRHLLWSLWAMQMRLGVASYPALSQIKEALTLSGHGQDMRDTIDYLLKGIAETGSNMGDTLGEAVAPYDKEEAIYLMIAPRMGSFQEAMGQIGEQMKRKRAGAVSA